MDTKNKKIAITSFIIILLAGSFLYFSPVVAADASLSMTIDTNPTKIGDTFIASINIAGVEKLWGWHILITWNSDVLSAISSVKGPFLTSGGVTDLHLAPINNDKGLLDASQFLFAESSVSGSGVLERITFEVIGTGNADIVLDEVALIDESQSSEKTIPFIMGQVPKITISVFSTIPVPGDTVIKVSTDKTTYSSGDLVSASAKVTANGGAVASMLVGFSIYQQDGTMISTEVASTNGLGTAVYTFNIPTAAVVFGEWSIVASVSVAEVEVTDIAKFNVIGSSLAITSISVVNTADTVQKSSKISLNITVTGTISEGSILTVSIFDSAQIPLDMFTVSLKPQTQDTAFITAEVTVPSWAFNGQATIYVNILNAIPPQGGVPYCSQATQTFLIS
jgi:hypothetical protein